MYIYPLSRILNTNLVSAYYGQDKLECECLKYLFIYYLFITCLLMAFVRTFNINYKFI
jgi:hypothetical protein